LIFLPRYRLTVQANASCVDLLVWAAMEEVTAESVLNRLADKIHSKDNNHLIMAHLPLLLVCLKALGQLAVKFTHLASNVIARQSVADPPATPPPVAEPPKSKSGRPTGPFGPGGF
jgi:phosphatidylinositol 4-kinase